MRSRERAGGVVADDRLEAQAQLDGSGLPRNARAAAARVLGEGARRQAGRLELRPATARPTSDLGRAARDAGGARLRLGGRRRAHGANSPACEAAAGGRARRVRGSPGRRPLARLLAIVWAAASAPASNSLAGSGRGGGSSAGAVSPVVACCSGGNGGGEGGGVAGVCVVSVGGGCTCAAVAGARGGPWWLAIWSTAVPPPANAAALAASAATFWPVTSSAADWARSLSDDRLVVGGGEQRVQLLLGGGDEALDLLVQAGQADPRRDQRRHARGRRPELAQARPAGQARLQVRAQQGQRLGIGLAVGQRRQLRRQPLALDPALDARQPRPTAPAGPRSGSG